MLGPYKEMLLIIASPAHEVVVVPPMRQAMTGASSDNTAAVIAS